jgi:general secretion pathway protein L
VAGAAGILGDTLNGKNQQGIDTVASKLIIRAIPQSDSFEWAPLAEGAAGAGQAVRGTLTQLAASLRDFTTQVQLVFLVPAVDALVRVFDFTEKERKHVVKTIPYMLEEDLLGEADDLHYVHGKPRQNQITVAAIDENCLANWLAQFEAAGLKLDYCVPEQCFLPPGGHEWVLHYSDGRFVVRFSDRERFAFDADAIELALQIASNDWADLPSAIDLRISHEDDRHDAVQLLPSQLHHLVTVTVQGWPELFARYESQAGTWNFLQGKFSRVQQWNKYWQLWKTPILVLVAAYVVQLAITGGEYLSLNKENLALRQQLDAAVREIFPRGQIVDHRRQVENELNRLKGGAGSAGFVAMLQQVGTALTSAKGLQIQSMTYDARNAELRLDTIVKDSAQVDAIIQGVQRAGLKAELQSSNAQGQDLRARLSITGGN